jgi:hypothetical protein
MSRRNTSLPSGSGAQRLGLEVEVHRAGQRVGDHQRRAGQVVHLDVRVDPALEVPVARQHRHDGQVGLVDRGRDLLGQRAGVADAGGAAVADQVVAQLLQVRPEAGLLVVVGDDLRAGAIDVFTHGLTARPLSTAFLASSAAPSITDGFDVLVHEVIEAITTAPWSRSKDVPLSMVTGSAC